LEGKGVWEKEREEYRRKDKGKERTKTKRKKEGRERRPSNSHFWLPH